MSRAARFTALTGALVLTVGLVAAAALALPGAFEKPAKAKLSVSQQGSITGLFPGRTSTVTLVVRNPSRQSVKLKTVTATPRAAGACPASMLAVGKAPASVLKKPLKARRSLLVRLPVTLARSAPDACQGLTFPLDLKATGKAVKRTSKKRR